MASPYNQLKACLLQKTLDVQYIDAKTVLPYEAKFIADPFIRYYQNEYHILCEAFLTKQDKRIAHLKSCNLQEWKWVRDVTKNENHSLCIKKLNYTAENLSLLQSTSTIYKKNIFRNMYKRLLKKPRLTCRPAGDILLNDNERALVQFLKTKSKNIDKALKPLIELAA